MVLTDEPGGIPGERRWMARARLWSGIGGPIGGSFTAGRDRLREVAGCARAAEGKHFRAARLECGSRP